MIYPELIESCKRAIQENRCLGCTGLEYPEYKGNPNCEYSKEITIKNNIKIEV